MVIKNLSTRPVTLRDEDGNLYVVPSLDELVLDDALIEDNTFKRWLRWRLRDIYISPFVNIEKNGVSVDSKPTLNFIEGTNTTLTLTDHADSIDIQIDAASDVDYNNLDNVPTTFPVAVAKGGTPVGTRPKINFIEGSNISLTIADNPGSARVDVTVNATGELSVDWNDLANKPSTFPPSGHQSSHQAGGSDMISGNLTANARVNVGKAGGSTGVRRKINFIEGSNITITLADDNAGEKVDVTIAASAAAPTNASYITTASESGLSAEKVLGASVIMKGTAASQPATAIDGLLYYINDSGEERLTRDTGAGWDDLLVDWDYVGGKPSTFTPSAHASNHAAAGSDPIKLDDLAVPDDNTDLDASTSHHGLLPKLSGDSSQVFRGDGTFGGGTISGSTQFLTSNVTLTSNVFSSPAELQRSCAPGLWLVLVNLAYGNGSTGCVLTAKVWDGTTVYFGTTTFRGSTQELDALSFGGVITLLSTTTVLVSITDLNSSTSLKTTPIRNGTGMTNKITYVTYIKLA